MFEDINKIKISESARHKASLLKNRTGLTPNIIARFAFCHSLNVPGIPESTEYDSDGMEFNRYTITGSYDLIMMALLAQRLEEDGLSFENAKEQFRLHVCRGLELIFYRVKSLLDLHGLFEMEIKS